MAALEESLHSTPLPNLPSGGWVGVQHNTRYKRCILIVIIAVVVTVAVIGVSIAVQFVLPLIKGKAQSTDTGPTGLTTGPRPTDNSILQWTEWSIWSTCHVVNCTKIQKSFRQRNCSWVTPRNVSKHDCYEKETRTCRREKYCTDCASILASGISSNGTYLINPDNGEPFYVFCDMTTDGGGWTVFQRRQDGSVDFNRTWNEYKTGFGNLLGEFWLGNEYIYRLTKSRNRTLRLDTIERGKYYRYYGEYGNVSLSNEKDHYRFHVQDHIGGWDGMTWMEKSRRFSTKDSYDGQQSQCANQLGGGWWHAYYCNLCPNGLYSRYFGLYASYIDRAEFMDFKLR